MSAERFFAQSPATNVLEATAMQVGNPEVANVRFTASVLLFKVEHLPASYPGYCEHFDVSLMVLL